MTDHINSVHSDLKFFRQRISKTRDCTLCVWLRAQVHIGHWFPLFQTTGKTSKIHFSY